MSRGAEARKLIAVEEGEMICRNSRIDLRLDNCEDRLSILALAKFASPGHFMRRQRPDIERRDNERSYESG
jgi:hypothetical protein